MSRPPLTKYNIYFKGQYQKAESKKEEGWRLNLLEEALCWCGKGDIGVVGVTVGWSGKMSLAAAVMQGDLVVPCLITAACYTLKTGLLHLWRSEE